MENPVIFKRGNNVKVFQKIVDGKKDRVVAFEGKVMKSRGTHTNAMITVRQHIDGVDVDRIIPVNSPSILKVELLEDKKKARKIATRQGKKSTKKVNPVK